MLTIYFPLLGILQAFDSFLNLFADDEGGADDTADKNDKFVDDLDNEFGEFDEDDDEGDDEGDDDADKSKKKDDADKSKNKKESSAVIQKKKYREQLREAKKTIKEYEDKEKGGGTLSAEEKKEKAAKEYLASAIKDVLKQVESEKEATERKEQQEFDDELEEVLDENTDITEDQILEVCEELEISPKQALKAIRREMKLTGKKKPKMPDSKRGDGEVSDSTKKGGDDKKPSTLDSMNRLIKEKLKKGLL